ncbi:MAG: transcriptional regulator [Flavobacteriales bacterium]|nr:transcriptional regulator [Flavobacteriales bacterium]|tara:strand:+ start:8168 stop:8458 length:291 start_codon:yes stop_codon:yes gene_type:complete
MTMSDNKINHIAVLLKSIGHPIRIKIIRLLSHHSYMSVNDISIALSVEQPVMSLHLAVLRKINVIKAEKRGKNAFYSLVNVNIKQIVSIAYYTNLD